ncbi:MAG TPA: Tm-1-like ATP-binding domain-containing protein [Pirellulaceae bacterium]|nr:Tm-1-like ATP-binding domain-containing protein [Pirellulaceae bacterium]
MAVLLIATLDTKGTEAQFVRARLIDAGLDVLLIDSGTQHPPTVTPEIDRTQVFREAGPDAPLDGSALGRGEAVTWAARGVAAVVRRLAEQGRVDGVLAIGGSAGTTIGSAAMRALPLSIPKVLVSTMASGDVRPYVGDRNLVMINSVVDIAGLNRISRIVLGQAADAMIGMVSDAMRARDASSGLGNEAEERPIIAATMFGVTTPCVQQARALLEQAGYEVLVFHATGSGGRAMETLIDEGLIAGVLDLTTTEWADELVGGVLSAGPHRLEAAGQRGIPQVVSVGALDMVNFGPRDSVPERFASRTFHVHNPTVTLMRTTADECRRLGEIIAGKLAAARGPAALMFPLQGISAIDRSGAPFDDPAARRELLEGLRSVPSSVPIETVEAHINDAAFAERCARRLLAMLAERPEAETARG